MSFEFLGFALKYSIRSLGRHRRRSLLLLATVVMSVGVAIVAKGFADEAMKFWIQQTTDAGPGHAQIHKRGFWDEEATVTKAYCFETGHPIEAMLAADTSLEGFGRRLEVEGLVSAGERAIYFTATGLEPLSEKMVSPALFGFAGNTGAFVDAGDVNGVSIGRGMAETLNVGIGDAMTLSVQTADNNLNATDVVVRGIINFPDAKLSKRLIYMNLPLAQQMTQLHAMYNEIVVRAKPGVDLRAWAERRGPLFAGVDGELRPWWDVFPPILKVQAIWQAVVGVISLLLFISTGLSVLTVIFLAVGERTIEIGILMALGAHAKSIRRLVAIEAVVVGATGSVLGMVIGNLAIALSRVQGIPLDNPFFEGYVYIKPGFDMATSMVTALFAMLICYVASILPARRASAVEPVVAFRGQA